MVTMYHKDSKGTADIPAHRVKEMEAKGWTTTEHKPKPKREEKLDG